MIHNEAHPLAGKTVKLKARLAGELAGADYRVEDWWDRVAGISWMNANGNPACIGYALRAGLKDKCPIDNEVLYGKSGGMGHLIHATEIEEPTK